MTRNVMEPLNWLNWFVNAWYMLRPFDTLIVLGLALLMVFTSRLARQLALSRLLNALIICLAVVPLGMFCYIMICGLL